MLLKELRHEVLKAKLEQKGLTLYSFGNARAAPYEDLTIENLLVMTWKAKSWKAISVHRRTLPLLSCCTGSSPALEESRTPTQNMPLSGQAPQPMRCFATTHSHYFYAGVSVTRPVRDNKTRSDCERNTGEVMAQSFGAIDYAAVPGSAGGESGALYARTRTQ